jgi:DNA-binding PadR family transcriptional regulator
MPAPPSNIPSYLERAAMDAIRGDPNYHASPATILKLLRKGWIEKTTGRGLRKYGITAAGEDALRAKMRTY